MSAPAGLALDDAAAARFEGTELAEIVCCSASAGGYAVAADGETALETRQLGG